MGILAHEEVVRRALREREARERTPTSGSVVRRVGGLLAWLAMRIAPFALVALGYAQSHDLRTPEALDYLRPGVGVLFSMGLHAACLLYLNPRGVGSLRVHEAMRMPSRRAILLARWARWLPRALFVGAAFAGYQGWFCGSGNVLEVARHESASAWAVAWMGILPLHFGILWTWWQVREPSSPECRFTGRLIRAVLGAFSLITVGFNYYMFRNEFSARMWLVFLAPLFLGAGWGALLVWFGLRGLFSALRSERTGRFRARLAAADLVAMVLILYSVVLTVIAVTVPEELHARAWRENLAWSVCLASALAAWVVYSTLWLHRTRELPGMQPGPEQGEGRIAEEEERRSSFPKALLRRSPPRGFAAAWAFRRRAAMAPVVPVMLFGFMAFCLWFAVVSPETVVVPLAAVLLYPTYIGFGVSGRLHLLGVGLRAQHLQNLRALALRVALPAAILCGLFIGALGPTRTRWIELGIVGAALVLRAGSVGYWRIARRFGIRTGLTRVLMALVFLPLLPPLFRIDAWFPINTRTLSLFYVAVGGLGLVFHLATLNEAELCDEERCWADRRVAA